MKDTPSRFSDSIWRNSSSVSSEPSAAVGSSRISRRDSRVSALAISTSCWAARRRSRTRVSGEMSRPSRSSCTRASRRMRSRSTSPWRVGIWPRKMFSATERSGSSWISWWIMFTPWAIASFGLAGA
ncbi:hypothetical protein D9M70_525890 [compost metagenome]